MIAVSQVDLGIQHPFRRIQDSPFSHFKLWKIKLPS